MPSVLDEKRLTRFWARIDRRSAGECWEWIGPVTANGYGRFSPRVDGVLRRVMAHRVAYEDLVGPIPDGLVIDHLCRNRRCVNPLHLEPVPQFVNVMRGTGVGVINAAKQECVDGHEFTAENTYMTPRGGRACRACQRRRTRECRERKQVSRA